MKRASVLAVAWVALASVANAESRYQLEPVQATLAVQALDGWLLMSEGESNTVALYLLDPLPTRDRWAYFIPAQGAPVVLAIGDDAKAFARSGGLEVVTLKSSAELDRRLSTVLRGKSRVAMEHDPAHPLPELNLAPAAAVTRVKALKVEVVSSAPLVQATLSQWGPEGRLAHYVAAHHLERLYRDAVRYIGDELRAGRKPTELDVQSRIRAGYAVRGLRGDPPVVAAGPNTADPAYLPTAAAARPIAAGDLIRISMWATLESSPRPVFANLTWMAYAGGEIPKAYSDAFAKVVGIRDAAIALIRDRLERRRPIRGEEVHALAREHAERGGFADAYARRTGHSLDTRVIGDGAHLQAGDPRPLVPGAGFTLEPGLYRTGQFGVASEVDLYIDRGGLEVTSSLQATITPIRTQ